MRPIGTGNPGLREEWLKRTLLKIEKEKTILDIGAGQLRYKPYCQHLKYTSQDLGEYTGEQTNVGLQHKWNAQKVDIISDITDISVEDESFDASMCIEVLEHVPDPAKAMKEICRVVKKGGKIIITAPVCSLTHQAPYYNCNGFSEFFYKYWFEEFGVELIDMYKQGTFYDWIAQELRRLPHICQKYSKETMNEQDQKMIGTFINMMNKYYIKENNSSELLCYGICVFGEKK